MTAVGSTSRELAWRPVDGAEIEMRHVGALQAEVEPKIDPYVELAPEREEIRRKLAEFHPPNDDEIAETARSRSMKTAWIAGLSVTGFFGLAGAVAVPALTKAKGFGPIAAAVAGGLIADAVGLVGAILIGYAFYH